MIWLQPSEWMSPDSSPQACLLWSIPELAYLREFLVEEKKLSLYLVGGAVRDLVLARPVKDFDLLVTCTPAELSALSSEISSRGGVTVFPLDQERGYFRVCYRNSEGVDLAALDRPTLWQDLRRRDITFNAMALDTQGRLADPFKGRCDLKAKRVRPVARDVLIDDPLRLLRCLRFAATLDFSLEEPTIQQLRELRSLLEATAGERIFEELRQFTASAKLHHWQNMCSSGILEAVWNLAEGSLPWEWLFEWRKHERQADLSALVSALLWQVAEREEGLERLRVSRAFLSACRRWWSGCESLKTAHPKTTREVYQLIEQTGDMLTSLLDFTDLSAFPNRVPRGLKERLLSAASGHGELRLTPLPVNGHEVCRHKDRPPGPWLREHLAELDAAWACREVNSLKQLLAYSAAI